ncbi:MAG: LysR family transcriptional regulator, partial [Methyloligellaceae bacterium]
LTGRKQQNYSHRHNFFLYWHRNFRLVGMNGMTRPKGADLRALEVFQEVCQAETMSQAARRLSMTQPAVSQHVVRLENALGTLLIDRGRRPLRLTPAGEVLRECVGQLLREADTVFAAVRKIGEVPLPTLRMSVPNSLSSTLVPPLYGELMKRLEPGGIHISCDQAVDLSRRFLDREIDLIITSDAMRDMDGLERREICREGYILALPARYQGPTDSLQQLAEHLSLIRFTARNLMGQDVERHLRRVGVEIPHRASFDAPSAVASVVGGGQGFAILTPLCLLEGRTDATKIACRELPTVAFSRTLTLVSRVGELTEVANAVAAAAARVLEFEVLPRIATQVGPDVLRFEIAKDGRLAN